MEAVAEEVRPGYKLTKLGWIPEDWKVLTLQEVATIQTGIQKGTTNNGPVIILPYIRVANVQDGYIDLSEIKHIEVSEKRKEKYLLRKGDVLMNEGGDFDKLGRSAVWDGQIELCAHQNHVFAVRVNEEFITSGFLNFLTKTFYGRKYFILSSKQSTNLASINSRQLKNFPVLLPPYGELRQIECIISKWDLGINCLSNIIRQKQLKKKALMQQLLTGKKRFQEFDDMWHEVSLKKLFKRVTRKNDIGNTNVVTISAQRGLVKQNTFFKKNVASKKLDNYYLLNREEFAYNKSYSNGYPTGAIKRLKNFDEAVVTTLYICFDVIDSEVTSRDFFEHFFEDGHLNQGLKKIAHEGGRAHGLLNVTPSDFFNIKIRVPKYLEQNKIATTLNTTSKEIKLLNQKLNALKDQKKGLMQQLLTGKKRLKIREEEQHD